jgi:hypothetical protein
MDPFVVHQRLLDAGIAPRDIQKLGTMITVVVSGEVGGHGPSSQLHHAITVHCGQGAEPLVTTTVSGFSGDVTLDQAKALADLAAPFSAAYETTLNVFNELKEETDADEPE